MCENILCIWESTAESDGAIRVIPDGCRDFIMMSTSGEELDCFVSPLFDWTHRLTVKADTRYVGFRMKPGAQIDENELLASVPTDAMDVKDVTFLLNEFSQQKEAVEEALNCLSSDIQTVAQAAKEIGVSQRTLQRLIVKESDRSPVYWMMLARARKAERALFNPISLVDVAEQFGYSDQSHMAREMKRWFGVSPSVLRNSPDIHFQLNETGYG